MFFISITSQMF